MIRKMVEIDEKKCTGCGLCAEACRENAIQMINGKAKLIRDDYCDGLGNCLPVCPANAITIIEREAIPFDKEAVSHQATVNNMTNVPSGCPGKQAKTLRRNTSNPIIELSRESQTSELMQWPVQLKLVPVNAPFFDNCNLLIAADCTAFAYNNFHRDFIKKHVTLIGCPKLDQEDYSKKLTDILRNNSIKSVKIVRMEVPCCKGIENAAIQALSDCGKMIPWQVIVISTDGSIIEE